LRWFVLMPWTVEGTVRGRLRLLLALAAVGCTGEPVVVELDSPVAERPSCGGVELAEAYFPTGTAVADATECPAWPASCPYLCRSPFCAGTEGALSCERCGNLDYFNESGRGCHVFRVDEGAFSHACR
jgi:hypothetical protein